MSPIKKKILKISLWSIGIILLLTIISFCLVYFNKEKIKSVIVSELNKQLITEIKVSSIDVGFFATFPFASLKLDDVTALDAFPDKSLNKDTLFYFKKVYLSFNVWDIIGGSYKIRKVSLKEGSFNMKVLPSGECNYIFWKESEKKTDKKFELSLNEVELRNVSYTYRNDYTRQFYEIFLKQASASGNFTDVHQKITIKSESILKRVQLDNLVLASEKDFDFDIDFSNNTNTKTIEVKKGDLSINKLRFDVVGNLFYGDSSNINLSIKSNKVKVQDMITLLPAEYKKLFDGYKSKGELKFNFNMNGRIDNKNIPNIKADFNISNAELINKKLNVDFTNINLNGKLVIGNNWGTSFIDVSNFSTRWNNGTLKGAVKLSNFRRLNIDAKVDCNLPLDALKKFLNQKEINQLSGQLNLNLKIKGDIKSLETISSKGFEEIIMDGKGNIRALNYIDTRMPYPVNNTNADFTFNNKSIIFDALNGSLNNSSVSFKGDITDIIPFVFKQRKNFNLAGDLKLGIFKITDWTKPDSSPKDSKQMSSGVALPIFMNANINLEASKFLYDKIEATGFKVTVKLIDGSISLNNMVFNAFGGGVNGNISLINSSSPRLIANLSVNKVDAHNFFYSLDNFDQSSITNKTIKGKVTASINLTADLNKDFSLIKDKINANISYKVENGELNDVPVLKKLSYFVEESALNNVTFGTIESNINIQNSCITFQDVNIKSNAINFTVLGKHYLDNRIDYRVRIQLSELASKKKKAKLEKQRKEFGEIEEDASSRMTLFVKIGGSVDKPTFAYDMKQNMEKVKETLKKDTEVVSKAIDKDLKLGIEQMKKDKQEWKRQERGEYVIEWEENKPKDTISAKDNKKDTKFVIEWDE